MMLTDQCKAELKLNEEKKSLREVRFEKRFIQHDLVKATGIPQSKISLIRAAGDKFKELSPVQIGKELSAGLVLYVRIENYGLYQMSDRGYYNGSMTIRSMLYDVESGKQVWPADDAGKLVRTQVELETGGRKPTSDRLVRATGYCIVRNFYDCIRNQYRIKDEVEDYNAEKYW